MHLPDPDACYRAVHGRDAPGTLELRLPYRSPMDLAATLEFLAQRAIPGVEDYDGTTFTRALRLPGGPGLVGLSDGAGHVRARLRLTDQRDLTVAVARVRRLLDLDADPVAVDEQLGADPDLGALTRKRPGLRSPGAVDGFEMAVRAVVGQQISVRGARTLLARIAAHAGPALDGEPQRLFPDAADVAAMDPARLPMPRRRALTLHALAGAVASGDLTLDPGADRDATRAALLALPGVGPWTADYLAMRTLADPDVLLDSDLGVRHASAALGISLHARGPAWAPWRSYATHHLWATLKG